MSVVERTLETISVNGVDVEVESLGQGSPILLLSSEEQLEREQPAIEALARGHRVVMPSLPGFGRSARPDWMTNPDDMAYVMLDLTEKMGLQGAALVGFSLGGWVAAEMATKDDSLFSKMVLVAAFGVKIGGPYDVDIQDVWILHPNKVAALKWRDLEKGRRDFSAMTDDQLTVVARNIESFARFCWDPYMHNPKLRHRLHRVSIPTLLVWGENDGIVTPAYGRAYAELIPGAKFETIAEAGHFPHIEQPQAFGRVLDAFLA